MPDRDALRVLHNNSEISQLDATQADVKRDPSAQVEKRVGLVPVGGPGGNYRSNPNMKRCWLITMCFNIRQSFNDTRSG